MNVLVTGSTGFIGSHLVDLLLRKNYSVRCIIRRSSDLQWLQGKNVEFIHGDLFDDSALRTAVTGVDYVYHSAGITKAKTREEYFRGNAAGTRNILRAVAECNPSLHRFVHISSQAAVGPSHSKTPISENEQPHPITTYGKSKLQAEQECHAMDGSIAITIVRPPAVFGPRDKDVFEFFNTMNKGLQPMVGLREKYVSLIHVRDLVRGFVMAGESIAAKGKTYFITSREVYDWRQIGAVARSIMGRRTLSIRLPEWGVYAVAAVAEVLASFSSRPALLNLEKARDMVQDFWTCDHRRAMEDFGFVQEIPLEEGIRDTVAWYRGQGWLS